MQIEKYNENQTKILIEHFSDEEYEKFLSVKTLPSYSIIKDSIIINNEFLKEIGINNGYKREKINFQLSDFLWDYQKFIVKLAILKKRFAVFASVGLGKTNIFLEYIEQLKNVIPSNRKILIVSPLMVIEQTINEQFKFYQKRELINCHSIGFHKWLKSSDRFGIVNYDLFRKPIDFQGKIGLIILDESSSLKHESSVIRTNIINASKGIEYKLCCTATPAPNDRAEFANHALFLEYIRSFQEFFSKFFMIRDDKWILKPHATEAFYKSLSNFSIFLRNPVSYGFEDNQKDIKEPIIETIHVGLSEEQRKLINPDKKRKGFFADASAEAEIGGITDRNKFSQISKGFLYTDNGTKRIESEKPSIILDLCQKHKNEQILIWTQYDEEGDNIYKVLSPYFSVENLSGKTSEKRRIEIIHGFLSGDIQILISKARLLGFGLNLQNVSVVIYSGLGDSYEAFHQSLGRVHRYGNNKQIHVYIPVTIYEEVILKNVLRKKDMFEHDATYQENLYREQLIGDLIDLSDKAFEVKTEKKRREMKIEKGNGWKLINDDNVKALDDLEENSIHFCMFSPPFADLFTYSSHIEDMGNCNENDDDFCMNYQFFAKKLLRVIMPGRKIVVHVGQLPVLKSETGYVGMKDFRGLIIESMNRAGFLTKGEVVCKLNQQYQSIVKHSPGLAMHIFEKDSNKSIPAYNDYYLIFEKSGENTIPITPYGNGEMTRDDWIKFASGVWLISEEVCDIKFSETLNTKAAKTDNDGRHVCPFPLEPLRRFIKLYSNPDEIILDPFSGIGSTGYIALQLNRKYVGIELKEEYFDASIGNLSLVSKKTGFRKSKSKFFA
jgi:superfamily II DNA or RNA helicase